MHGILILMENRQNLRLLVEILRKKYRVIVPEGDDKELIIKEGDYDLGIFDGPSLDRYWTYVQETRVATEPLFLPFILVTSRHDVEYITRHLWKSVDEIVISPIKKVELEARINILLRARKYSYEQQARLKAEKERDLIIGVLDRVSDGIVALDGKWNFVYLNEKALKMLGKQYLTEVLHRNYLEVFPEDTPISRALKDAWEYKIPVRIEYYEGSLSSFFEVRIFPSSEGLTVLITDITERKLTEEKLRYSEENYRNIFQNAPVGLFRSRISDGKIIECNDQLARMIGFKSREEIISKEIVAKHRYVDPDAREKMIKTILKTGCLENFETGIYGKDGSIIWVRVSARISPMYDDCIEGVAEDITAQKQAEEALRESEERYRRLAENAPDIIYRYELIPRCGFTYVSPAVTAIVGYTPDEHYSDPELGFKIVHPDDRYLLEKLLEGKIPCDRPLVLRWIHKNGSVIWTEQRNVPIYDEQGNMIALEGIARDITDRKKAEEEREKLQQQILQLQKMESIGRLAGGIAHDFNNVLNVILGYGEIILSKLHPQDPLREYVTHIVEAGKRAANLTQQLLAFSRKQTLKPQVTDINILIRNIEDMLHRLVGEDVILELSLSSNIGMVKVDPVQIEQVILNLVVNARDAMPHGGKLLIKTTTVNLDKDYVARYADLNPGKYVVLSVTDTGIGMDKETLSRIFEPFFTTKEKGTGLGLATAYGIVRQSGGHIWVYSEPGRGTTFKIYLPVVEAKSEIVSVKSEELHSGRGEHILVVEDEKSLRELMVSFLTMLGYTVTVAANGGEALLLVEEKGVIPDLIITDIVMPYITGKQLVERLRRKHPYLKVIYMSGYASEAVFDKEEMESNTLFIQKPFSPKKLSEKIRMILNY